MIRTLTRASLLIHLILAALPFATVFAIKANYFQHHVTAKQCKFEQTTLFVIAFLILSFPFVKKIEVSLIDAGVLLCPLWWEGVNENGAGDVSLDAIAVMARAQDGKLRLAKYAW